MCVRTEAPTASDSLNPYFAWIRYMSGSVANSFDPKKDVLILILRG